ncbi:MAG: UvrD-helicase domain-containing protein [Chloroflexota bacterium]|nr:UvrD-helicase domain-containing protein [Chloroflexota bacterium]
MNLLRDLNPQQQQAVGAGTGPVLVLAGPGSGKTRVLTQRIAYLIGHLGVRPYHVLAVTFTNKAAREMEERVTELLGQRTHGLTLGTFHATCARILRREADYLPFDSNYVIFDSDDQLRVVKQALKDLEIDDKQHRPRSIHAAISRAKNELIFDDDLPVLTYGDEIVKRVYQRYQQTLLASNALDFDDLLMWAVYLFDEQPTVRNRYARRYEYILVDEFQDTNMAQYLLLKHFASFHENIFVVGDVDQSIYRWRGADYRNVLRFEENFADAEVILLEQNYRSTQNILNAAMAVINRNPHRKKKKLFTERGQGRKITLRETYDDRETAAFVVSKIAKDTNSNNAQPGDFAIMYRTNAQSRVLEEAFLAANMPYKLVGAQRFYGRREIKDVISYLRLVHNPKDEISLMRAINTPRRGIGTKTIASLRTYAQQQRTSSGEVLLGFNNAANSHGSHFSTRAARVLSHFGKMLGHWYAHRDELSPLKLMDLILDDVNYRDYIDDDSDEGNDRWENVTELRRLAGEYEERRLEEFLENVALVSDQDTLDPDTQAPALMTLHAAKGLEFPVVFIVGVNDRTLPHSRSHDDPEAMQEERRLFYVGITRAEDELCLLHSLNRYSYGYSEPAMPSRFLDDIPLELLDDAVSGRNRKPSRSSIFRPQQWDAPSTSARIIQKNYKVGMRVMHPAWGRGVVLSSKLDDDEEIVKIIFEDDGFKRVAASVAPLEIVEP